ncbi:MAG: DUF167 domain-containing protein [Candidatus Margulisbacteria bacterium]|nr:DUF167 domain-containing protein [Candidatus Margulisiibacteriota bacterium]
MIVNVRVIPRARQNKIVEEPGRYKVYLNAPPVEGKANQALIGFLAEHFGVKRSRIRLIRGEKNRDKVIEIKL